MTTAHAPRPLELGLAFEDVLLAARADVPGACRAIYESLAGRVCGYLRSHGAPEPEDLASEVFLRVFEHLDDFMGDEAGFRSWVFTITHRILIDDRRRRSCRPRGAELAVVMAEAIVGGDAEHDAMNGLARKRVDEALATLSPDQRDVITLRFLADLGIAQVARALRKRPCAIKALQRRGLRRLRQHLEGVSS